MNIYLAQTQDQKIDAIYQHNKKQQEWSVIFGCLAIFFLIVTLYLKNKKNK